MVGVSLGEEGIEGGESGGTGPRGPAGDEDVGAVADGRGNHFIWQTGDVPAFGAVVEVVGGDLEGTWDDDDVGFGWRVDERGGEAPAGPWALGFPEGCAGFGVEGEDACADILIAIDDEALAGEDWRGAASVLGDGDGERVTPEFPAVESEGGCSEGAEVDVNGLRVGAGGRGGWVAELGAVFNGAGCERTPPLLAAGGAVECEEQELALLVGGEEDLFSSEAWGSVAWREGNAPEQV